MLSFISPLFWLSSVAATGFIYPPSGNVNPSQNLTVHEGDVIIVAYNVDSSAIQVNMDLVCETPINTDLVPFPINGMLYNNTGLASYEIPPGSFEGNNTDFYSNICFLQLNNVTFTNCTTAVFQEQGPDFPADGPGPAFGLNGTLFGNSTWLTILKQDPTITTFTAPPTSLGSLSNALTALPTDLDTGNYTCSTQTTVTYPSLIYTDYSSALAAEATQSTSTTRTSAASSSATSKSAANSKNRRGAGERIGKVAIGGMAGLIGLGFGL